MFFSCGIIVLVVCVGVGVCVCVCVFDRGFGLLVCLDFVFLCGCLVSLALLGVFGVVWCSFCVLVCFLGFDCCSVIVDWWVFLMGGFWVLRRG